MFNRKTNRVARCVVVSGTIICALIWPTASNADPPAQPLAGLWFTGFVPDPGSTNAISIQNWNPAADPDTPFNVSTVPLAPRFAPTPVNSNATNTSVGLDSLAVFPSESQGTTSMLAYTPTYWQYTTQLVDFGGAAGSANLLAPPSAVVDAAHRNGVPVLGTVFLAPGVYGGTISEVNAMLTQKADGSFPVADKMILAAQTMHFDGWFINQETEGGNSTTASQMQKFIQYIHGKAPGLTVEWYDAMDTNGNIDYRNELDSLNQSFFQKSGTTGTGVTAEVANSMFLNYNWSGTGLANSASLATSLGRSPYSLYAGINVQSGGYNTSVNWAGIFPSGTGASARTSIGLFIPNSTYNNAASGSNDTQHTQNFYANESNFWVGANADPSNTSTPVAGTTWNGIANYIAAQAPSVTGTFVTSFSTGQGHFYDINGVNMNSSAEWSNMGLQDIQPTWRWLMSSTGTKLTPSIDLTLAYNGGASLKVTGSTAAANTLQLFATQIPLAANSNFRIAFDNGQANSATNLALALSFSDGTSATVSVGNTSSAAWNTTTLSLGAYAGKTLSTIGLQFDGSNSALSNYSINIGQLLVYQGSISTPAPPTAVVQTGGGATDSSTNGSVRLEWTGSISGDYEYNVYQRLANNSLSWVGGTPDNAYFVPDVKRQGTSNFVNLEVETVAADTGVSSHATVAAYVDWSRAAETLTWQANGSTAGGAGTWDTQALKWNAGPNSPANQYWSNSWNDTAVFGGTGGTVTLASPISAGRMTFNSTGYTIAGIYPLTLSGNLPIVTVSPGAVNAAVSMAVQGTAGLYKSGPGNLTLSGINTYSGTTTVGAGTLTITNPSAVGASSVSLAGGTLALNIPQTAPTISGFNTFTLTKGASADGPSTVNGVLTLTDDVGNEANSAFTAAAVPISATGFTASFSYQNTTGADGMTFTIQNDPRGAAACGGLGGALAYNGTGSTAITNSGSVQFNIYSGTTVGTSFATNGVIGAMQSTSPVNVATSQDPIGVVLNYNGINHTLLETLTDQTTGSTFSTTYSGVNFSSLLSGNSGYVGFTGATGAVTSDQTISNFTFSNTAPISGIANAISAVGGTSSVIRLSVSPASTAVSVGSLTINSGATVQLVSAPTVLGTPAVLVIPTLNDSGLLDVTLTSLDLPGASLSSINSLIKQGQSGTGILSSTASADPTHLTTLGVIPNTVNGSTPLYGSGAPMGLFEGMSPGLNDVLIKLTYYGDTNLDGKVDGTDYSQIDFGYLHHSTGWYNGDFNYDGVIDGSDYALIDNSFNQQGAQIAAMVATSLSSVSTVPEPSAMVLLSLGAMLLRRSKRKDR
jgi:autotransporter-associated beta strand protein